MSPWLAPVVSLAIDTTERAGVCLAANGSPPRLCAMTLAPAPGAAFTATAAHARTFADGIVANWDPAIRDFAAARNRLLAKAAAAGYDWGVMLDCDERILVADRHALRRYLAESPAALLTASSQDGAYEKERLFRLPAQGRYTGLVHEYFVLDAGAGPSLRLATLTFAERPKTHEESRARYERDRPILEQLTQDQPEHPRWWYYLGTTHAGLGWYDDAVAAFETCYRLDGWPEEAAWAAYQTASIWIDEDPAVALDWCLAGMQRHPGIAELPCLAGWCCYRLGRYQDAVWWATLAASLNTAGADRERRGFRDPSGLYEVPFNIMRHAARVLGDDALARHAEQRFAELFLLREGWSLETTTPDDLDAAGAMAAARPASGQTSVPMLRAVLPHPAAPPFDQG